MGKSSKQETTQESKPPKWAQPLLERGAGDAMKLYDSGQGFNTYTGPTQTALSDPTLSGMNNMLAATGYSGGPVSNESINKNVPDVQAIMQQMLAGKQRPDLSAQQPLWQKEEEKPDPFALRYGFAKGSDPDQQRALFRKKGA